jgi:integrase/recombinase XerD
VRVAGIKPTRLPVAHVDVAGLMAWEPKELRHAFAVEAGQKGIPLNTIQRWLGHARIETTSIYANALGDEERNLARRAWSLLERTIPERRG